MSTPNHVLGMSERIYERKWEQNFETIVCFFFKKTLLSSMSDLENFHFESQLCFHFYKRSVNSIKVENQLQTF